MSGKKRQTFDKMNRERAVREKRARKAEKKAEKKLAAQGILLGETPAEGDDVDAGELEADDPTGG